MTDGKVWTVKVSEYSNIPAQRFYMPKVYSENKQDIIDISDKIEKALYPEYGFHIQSLVRRYDRHNYYPDFEMEHGAYFTEIVLSPDTLIYKAEYKDGIPVIRILSDCEEENLRKISAMLHNASIMHDVMYMYPESAGYRDLRSNILNNDWELHHNLKYTLDSGAEISILPSGEFIPIGEQDERPEVPDNEKIFSMIVTVKPEDERTKDIFEQAVYNPSNDKFVNRSFYLEYLHTKGSYLPDSIRIHTYGLPYRDGVDIINTDKEDVGVLRDMIEQEYHIDLNEMAEDITENTYLHEGETKTYDGIQTDRLIDKYSIEDERLI